MSERKNLISLAEKVEVANSGRDRDLEREIFSSLGTHVLEKRGSDRKAWWYPLSDTPYSRRYADDGGAHSYPPGFPSFTASFDAAMTLVDSECFWQVGHDGDGPDPSMFSARVFDPLAMTRPCTAVAKTPYLALTAACLRAIAGKKR